MAETLRRALFLSPKLRLSEVRAHGVVATASLADQPVATVSLAGQPLHQANLVPMSAPQS